MARPKPRKWVPKNPHKYAGDPKNIVSRSSWETAFMNMCDTTDQVLMWNSEGLVIPYYNKLDDKMHRYFVDFLVKMRIKDGSEKIFAIEIKPYKETIPPVPTRNKKRLLLETTTYITNQAKWEAARAFCTKKGIEFIVMTERELKL